MNFKFFFVKLGAYALNALPNCVVQWMGAGLGFFWFYIVPVRRKLVIANLTTAFGDTKSPEEIEALAYKNLKHIGKVLFESWRSLVWKVEDFRRNVGFEGFEHIEPYVAKKQGGFLLSAHMGCWELSPGSGASYGVPVDVVAKYADRKSAQPFLKWFRERLGVGCISADRSRLKILDSISRGRWIGFMLDQFMGPPPGVPVKFFGKLAGTTASLAAMTEADSLACLLAYTYRNDKGRITTVIEPLTYPNFSEDLTTRIWEKTQFYNDVIERVVRKYPDQWMWLHRRWKPFVGTPKWALPDIQLATL